MVVYILMFQIGPSANTVGACSTFNRALQLAEETFVANLLMCGAIEYGAEAMRTYEAISARVGTDDLVLSVRKPIPRRLTIDEEIWIDACTKDGTDLQAAIITITAKSLDDAKAPPQGGVRFVLPAHETKQ